MRPRSLPLLLSFLVALLSGCAGAVPDSLGGLPGNEVAGAEGLAPCASSKNCVIEGPDPLALGSTAVQGSDIEALASAVEAALLDLPRTRVVRREVASDQGFYLRAESRSRIFRFVDDVEVLVMDQTMMIRSASRVGEGDLGVNRARVASLRKKLRARGILGT
jgi:uncharacterized protein (DUF1499 family)